jgi:long-chain acyl-CoA synthetase
VNIAEEIFKRANPAAPAVLQGGQTTTYGDLERRSAFLVEKLRPAIANKPAARLGLSCPDSADYIAMALAILRAGGCFVPLAPELVEPERKNLIEEVALDSVVRVDKTGEVHIESLPTRPAEPSWLWEFEKLAPAFLRFSSGTTGDSKGIVLSHRSLWERITAANAGLGISPEDRILWVLPMSHHFAVSIMLYLWHGAAVILPESHLAGDILAAAERHRATVVYAAPFHFESLAGHGAEKRAPLRLAVSTTAGLPSETARRFAEIHGVFPAQALGIIECGLPCLNLPAPENLPQSVGRPQPAFEAELRGEPARLHLRGPGFLDAYLSPWKPRSEILDKTGWFATGDIASLDAEGRVVLLGRAEAVIGVGGMKFFPEEVEAVLNSHPAVIRSWVFGRPHPDFGMVPVAEVVLKTDVVPPTAVELLSLCRSQLSRHKIPSGLRFVDSIPLTPSGKIKRAGPQ